MSVSPLAGASGAVAAAQSTEAGHVIVCVPPAVSFRVNAEAVPVTAGLVNVNVVLPVVESVNTVPASQSTAGVVPERVTTVSCNSSVFSGPVKTPPPSFKPSDTQSALAEGSVVPLVAVFARYVSNVIGDTAASPVVYAVAETHRAAPAEDAAAVDDAAAAAAAAAVSVTARENQETLVESSFRNVFSHVKKGSVRAEKVLGVARDGMDAGAAVNVGSGIRQGS